PDRVGELGAVGEQPDVRVAVGVVPRFRVRVDDGLKLLRGRHGRQRYAPRVVGADDLAAALTPVLAAHLDDDRVHVEQLRRLSGGASRETWSFDAVMPDRVIALVFRRDIDRGVETSGAADEVALLRAASRAGVPVPAVVLDGAIDGRPFLVMERVDGETIPRRILRDDAYADARAGLAAQCGTALAAVHRIQPDDV